MRTHLTATAATRYEHQSTTAMAAARYDVEKGGRNGDYLRYSNATYRSLQKLGALVWEKVVQEHQGWRLLTCIWLHAGVAHLLANMISLVLIGLRLEQQFGYVRIDIIYLDSGVGGNVLSSLFIRNTISVGASGALFGLLGVMLSELFINWTVYSVSIFNT
ncbi:RHOMBOID-like protein 3 [Miscanthus floridulus]|uniref:RHOMBOID-like protein 3 n=1 Tax=Miscanthus floridulus TaxID=154761 RepID=UPI00345959F3